MGHGRGGGAEAAVFAAGRPRVAEPRCAAGPRRVSGPFCVRVMASYFMFIFPVSVRPRAFKSPTLARAGTSLLTGAARGSMPVRSVPVGISAGSGSGVGVAIARAAGIVAKAAQFVLVGAIQCRAFAPFSGWKRQDCPRGLFHGSSVRAGVGQPWGGECSCQALRCWECGRVCWALTGRLTGKGSTVCFVRICTGIL